MTEHPQPSPSDSGKIMVKILGGSAILFAILESGLLWLAPRLDQTWAAIIATTVMLGVALFFEKIFFGLNPLKALRGLGYGPWNPRAVLAAVIIAASVQLFYPIVRMATEAQITLKADWLWLLLGSIVLNGLGEETLFRGYIFGGLRQKTGLSFRRAGWISMAVFAAIHLFLFIGNPPFVPILGALVAMAAAFPMAYLFERGNNTIWASAVLHISSQTIRFVDISEPYYVTVAALWLVLQMGAVFLVYLFLGNLLKPAQEVKTSVAPSG
jgi:membrane protease YdiL (CAAX protease family)